MLILFFLFSEFIIFFLFNYVFSFYVFCYLLIFYSILFTLLVSVVYNLILGQQIGQQSVHFFLLLSMFNFSIFHYLFLVILFSYFSTYPTIYPFFDINIVFYFIFLLHFLLVVNCFSSLRCYDFFFHLNSYLTYFTVFVFIIYFFFIFFVLPSILFNSNSFFFLA